MFWFYFCMSEIPVNTNFLSQPSPNVINGKEQKDIIDKPQQRAFNLPKVGVVGVPVISKTPIQDTIEIKKQENPRTIYKLTPKGNKGFKIQNLFTIGTLICAFMAFLELKKGKTKTP